MLQVKLRWLLVLIFTFRGVDGFASTVLGAVVLTHEAQGKSLVIWENYQKDGQNKKLIDLLKRYRDHLPDDKNLQDVVDFEGDEVTVNLSSEKEYRYLTYWINGYSYRDRLGLEDKMKHIMEETSGSAKEKRRFLDRIFKAYSDGGPDKIKELTAFISKIHLQTHHNIRLTLKQIDNLSELTAKSDRLADEADHFYKKTRKAAHPCCDCCYYCEVGCGKRASNRRCLFF